MMNDEAQVFFFFFLKGPRDRRLNMPLYSILRGFFLGSCFAYIELFSPMGICFFSSFFFLSFFSFPHKWMDGM